MESFRIIEKNGVILLCNAGNLLIQMGKEEKKNIYIERERTLGSRKRGRNKKKRRKGRRKEKKWKRKIKRGSASFFPFNLSSSLVITAWPSRNFLLDMTSSEEC